MENNSNIVHRESRMTQGLHVFCKHHGETPCFRAWLSRTVNGTGTPPLLLLWPCLGPLGCVRGGE